MNKDEFDEFGSFDREKLNRLFRERMGDEDFRKKFFSIVDGYQRDYEGIMKLLFGMNYLGNPFSQLNNKDKGFFGPGLDFTAFNEDGWASQSWVSPDGKSSITSFTRTSTGDLNNHYGYKEELPTEYVIDLLENQLNLAVENEEFEEAAEIRDTIKSLKEEKNK